MPNNISVEAKAEFDFVEHLGTINVDPDDVIVIKIPGEVEPAKISRLDLLMQQVFPDNKIIIITNEIDIGKMRVKLGN